MNLENVINDTWEDRSLLKETNSIKAIEKVIDLLDSGEIRVAEKINDNWTTHEWIKKAVVFSDQKNGNY